MKTFLVTAYNGIGKDKTFAGQREIQEPENVQEALQVYGTEADLLEYAFSSYKIEIQRQIRAGTTVSVKQQLAEQNANMSKMIAFAQANPDSDVAKTLTAIGVQWQKAESNATTEATPTPPVEAKEADKKPARSRS